MCLAKVLSECATRGFQRPTRMFLQRCLIIVVQQDWSEDSVLAVPWVGLDPYPCIMSAMISKLKRSRLRIWVASWEHPSHQYVELGIEEVAPWRLKIMPSVGEAFGPWSLKHNYQEQSEPMNLPATPPRCNSTRSVVVSIPSVLHPASGFASSQYRPTCCNSFKAEQNSCFTATSSNASTSKVSVVIWII